jgi:hypothetical protein
MGLEKGTSVIGESVDGDNVGDGVVGSSTGLDVIGLPVGRDVMGAAETGGEVGFRVGRLVVGRG